MNNAPAALPIGDICVSWRFPVSALCNRCVLGCEGTAGDELAATFGDRPPCFLGSCCHDLRFCGHNGIDTGGRGWVGFACHSSLPGKRTWRCLLLFPRRLTGDRVGADLGGITAVRGGPGTARGALLGIMRCERYCQVWGRGFLLAEGVISRVRGQGFRNGFDTRHISSGVARGPRDCDPRVVRGRGSKSLGLEVASCVPVPDPRLFVLRDGTSIFMRSGRGPSQGPGTLLFSWKAGMIAPSLSMGETKGVLHASPV